MGWLGLFGSWWSTLAVAAAAASIPVIIHLLNRRRYQVVVWAAMRFLLNAQKRNTRRMRIEQLILLLIRVALVVLLVFAMASVMPWAESVWARIWPDGAGLVRRPSGRIHKILVLDASLSMTARHGEEGTVFEAARKKALDLVQNAETGHGYSVLLMKEVPEWIVPGVETNAPGVAAAIREAKATHGNGGLVPTIDAVAAQLARSPARYQARQVFFFTDLQRATWLPGKSDEKGGRAEQGRLATLIEQISKRSQVVIVNLRHKNTRNLAVTDLQIDRRLVTTGMPVTISATVRDFSGLGAKGLKVELRVGRGRSQAGDLPFEFATAGEQRVTLPPGAPTTVHFSYKFAKAGDYAIEVRCAPDDLLVDNSRRLTLTVRDHVPVLVVDGKHDAAAFRNGSDYLKMALNPFLEGPVPRAIPFRHTVVTPTEFADMAERDLAKYDCIYLCDLPFITQDHVRQLTSHLRRGGGVVVGLGEKAAEDLKRYNDFLFQGGRGILPARLIGVEQAPPKCWYSPYAKDFDQPPLSAFAEGADRNAISNVHIHKYVRVQPAKSGPVRLVLQLMSQKQPDAKLDPGQSLREDDPLLLLWQPPLPRSRPRRNPENRGEVRGRHRLQPRYYRGVVALLTTTWNMDWTSWPASPSYGAMVQELTRVAVSGRLQGHSALVGTVLDRYLPSSGGRLQVQLFLPDGTDRQLTTSGEGELTLFRWPYTERSGTYRLAVADRDYLFAVNPPKIDVNTSDSESNLRWAEETELAQVFPGSDFKLVADPADATLPQTDSQGVWEEAKLGPEIARYFLYIVVLLLWVEIILACVFGHHSAVPGSQNPARSGWLLVSGAGFAAGLVFVAVAAVLYHARATGDFLGFLPNDARAWIERVSGIPAPPSGESRRWEPEFNSYLIDAVTDGWLAGAVLVAYAAALVFIYRREGYNLPIGYKAVLGGLRWVLMFLALTVWLPQFKVNIKRESWPDIIVLVDDSLSMGETDQYRDEEIRKRIDAWREALRDRLRAKLPAEMARVEKEISRLEQQERDEEDMERLALLRARLEQMKRQADRLNSASWQPTRLQLAQHVVLGREESWLQTFLKQRQMRVHLYHLDVDGKAAKLRDAKGKVIALTRVDDAEQLDAAHRQLASLQPHSKETQLGTAVRQILGHFGGSSVAAIVILSDGITTSAEDLSGYERNLALIAKQANVRGIPLFLVGIGDDHELRDLRLHDLQVESTVTLGERVIFEARLTGKGFDDLRVPVVLKVREVDGTETEIDRKTVKIDPRGRPVRIQLWDRPNKPGEKLYVVEVIPPKSEGEEEVDYSNLRLQRTVFVQEAKKMRVLYVEGQPRYEFRYVKYLLEREKVGPKGKQKVELKVLLVEADPDWHETDATALASFPPTQERLNEYDVVILGDVNPLSTKFGEAEQQMVADFVREKGGGLLVIAGPLYMPHSYRRTPLASILPVSPDPLPPRAPAEIVKSYRPELTPVGQLHPIFRFSPNQAENFEIWNRLQPMYWWSSGYRLKPAAEVLAVHPTAVGSERFGAAGETRLPLVVQHFVGAGRCLFFGFEETWRWRFRDDEIYYNKFWIETIRYLARSRINHTRLFLDRQTAYQRGEKVTVTVRFPENSPVIRTGEDDKPDVRILIQQIQDEKGRDIEGKVESLVLNKVEGSWATFEGQFTPSRQGKYRIWLASPDVRADQPNGKQPSTEADVITPPGELDHLRMNREDMMQAAKNSGGEFYTLADAENLPQDVPSGFRVLLNAEGDPWSIWNHSVMFILAIGLLTTEWVLRKRRHLL